MRSIADRRWAVVFEESPALSPPDWRWRRARRAVYKPFDALRRPNDGPTQDAVDLLKDRLFGRPPAAGTPLAAAAAVYEGDGPSRWLLEAHVLTGRTTRSVARKVGLGHPVVAAYEAVFFDVRHRLKAAFWLMQHVPGIGAVLGIRPDDLGAIWRRAGYRGGRPWLDVVYAATSGVGRDELSPEVRDRVEIHVGFGLPLAAHGPPPGGAAAPAAPGGGERPAAVRLPHEARPPPRGLTAMAGEVARPGTAPRSPLGGTWPCRTTAA